MKSPAFQWYPADYLGSQRVQLMTLEEEGAYRRLLDYCWLHGSIPADISLLARLIGKGASTTLATTVSTMFQPKGDRLVHDRLDSERRKQEQWRAKSAEGGRKGAATRAKRVAQKPDEQQPDNGSLPNGINQKATLQSSVFSLQSSDLGKAAPSPAKPSAPRERNALMDTLASVDGSDPLQVTGSAWPTIATALKHIRAVTPDVTPEEIRRRRDNYVANHPTWACTPSAIAKHWAASATRQPQLQNANHGQRSSRSFDNQQDYSAVTEKL